jgi:hypothetical protein
MIAPSFLMGDHMRKTLVVLAVAAAALTVTAYASDAYAASRAYCRDYAQEATRQVRTARDSPACWRRIDNQNRWVNNYWNHYEWCLSVPREWVQFERYRRSQHLQDCQYRWRDRWRDRDWREGDWDRGRY